jgi:hypothetical protein
MLAWLSALREVVSPPPLLTECVCASVFWWWLFVVWLDPRMLEPCVNQQ